MEVKITHEHGNVPVSVLHIDGDVDSTNYEELERISFEEIDKGGRYILYDLSQVPFMSSAGLRALLKVVKKLSALSNPDGQGEYKGLQGNGKKSPNLKLFQPNTLVFKTMELAGLDGLVEVFEDMPAAVDSFGHN